MTFLAHSIFVGFMNIGQEILTCYTNTNPNWIQISCRFGRKARGNRPKSIGKKGELEKYGAPQESTQWQKPPNRAESPT